MRWLLVLILCFVSCTSSPPQTHLNAWMEKNGKVKVLSTTAMIDDLVGQIGQEKVDHLPLITGEVDPHSYELVKGDDEKISCASLIVFNGLGLEHGASLKYQLQRHPKAVAVGDFIVQNHPERVIRVDGQLDPHIWLDISLWTQAVDPIVEALSELDPENAAFYHNNGQVLKEKMGAVDEDIRTELQSLPANRRYLVTSHDAFNYFTRRYLAEPGEENWQPRFAAPEGLAPDGQLSTADIQEVIDHLVAYQITTVFPESNISKDSLRKIVSCCAEGGLIVKVSQEVLYGDAMGSLTYLGMMQHNAQVLFKELSAE